MGLGDRSSPPRRATPENSETESCATRSSWPGRPRIRFSPPDIFAATIATIQSRVCPPGLWIFDCVILLLLAAAVVTKLRNFLRVDLVPARSQLMAAWLSRGGALQRGFALADLAAGRFAPPAVWLLVLVSIKRIPHRYVRREVALMPPPKKS